MPWPPQVEPSWKSTCLCSPALARLAPPLCLYTQESGQLRQNIVFYLCCFYWSESVTCTRKTKLSFPLLAPVCLFSFNPCMTSLTSFVKFLTADLHSLPLLFLVVYREEFPIYFLLHGLAFACPPSQSSFMPAQPSFFSMGLWFLCVGRKTILNSSQLSVTDSCSNSFFQLFCFVIIFSFVKLALEIIK